MKINRKMITSILLSCCLFGPARSKASMFGEENVVLFQLLEQSIRQYLELQRILKSGQDTLGMMKEINQGINDSLNLIRTIKPDIDPGIYGDLTRAQEALKKLEEVYGIVTRSPDSRMFHDADRQAAEAIALNNSIYKYTQQIDQIGENVKQGSHYVSPGGAQKLTAQAMGVLLHVVNESLRAQATSLKLQAMQLSIQNKKDKEFTTKTLEMTEDLKRSMQTEKTSFQVPRF